MSGPASPDITFKPLTAEDFPHMHRWLNNSEVSPWYGLGLANVRSPTLEEVSEHYTPRMLGQTPTRAWTIRLAGRRIGYIQCYRTGDWPPYAEAECGRAGAGFLPGGAGGRESARRSPPRLGHRRTGRRATGSSAS